MTNMEGLKESAARIERVLEAARTELGKADADTNWQGLTQNFQWGAEETNNFARQLAQSQDSDHSDALVHAFILRQLEITMGFLARLSEAVVTMQERMERMEQGAVGTTPLSS
jgi:hypothetical protein